VLAISYTVPLALYDYVPVLLSGLGSILLVRYAAARMPGLAPIGWAGVVLTVAGGLCKASWKLVVAATGTNLERLEQLLFPLLAVGFTLLAFVLMSVLLERRAPRWPFALILGLGAVGALLARTMAPLLGVTSLMSLSIVFMAMIVAWRAKVLLAVVLFAINVVGVLALVPLGSDRIEQTEPLQWIEQSINTAAQGAYALAWFLVLRRTRPAVPSTHSSPSEALHGQ
jgi:hypothetical protein